MKFLLAILQGLGVAATSWAAQSFPFGDSSKSKTVFRPMIFASEGAKKIMIFAKDGSVAWEYPAEMSRDAWRLSNGNVLFCYNEQYNSGRNDNPSGVMEISPDKKVVFHFRTTGQVWSCQRMADGNTLHGAASQGKLLIANPNGQIVKTIKLRNAPGHSCLRNARQLANGNFLVAEESRARRARVLAGRRLRCARFKYSSRPIPRCVWPMAIRSPADRSRWSKWTPLARPSGRFRTARYRKWECDGLPASRCCPIRTSSSAMPGEKCPFLRSTARSRSFGSGLRRGRRLRSGTASNDSMFQTPRSSRTDRRSRRKWE